MFKDIDFNRSLLRVYFNRLFNADYDITVFENVVTLTLPEKSILFNINNSGNLDIVLKEKTN